MKLFPVSSNKSKVGAEFDVALSINSFDIWWQDQENGDDSCVWTISIEVNGAEVSNDESDCQDDGTELIKRTHNLATSVELVAGILLE